MYFFYTIFQIRRVKMNSYCNLFGFYGWNNMTRNGILLPKLYWPTVRKNCSSDREKLLKFKAEGQEFAKFLRSLEQFIQIAEGQKNLW